MKTYEIFKLHKPFQRDLNEQDYRYYLSNKDRSITGKFRPTAKIRKMFNKGEFEIYFFGRFDEKEADVIALEKANKDIFLKGWKIKCNLFQEALEIYRNRLRG